ncbi:hypothetical protein SV7mr_18960 [Stieleria bergensis]|uniref:GYF domain-containing protein n=1 Tax=Stieleria bergensis TaxID=2528025 RepID=A0A517STD7_9BACT|nr:hypothetical protein SV7mr_18960 [Planctomycetes bacterium SV_7m_r]
MSSDRVYIRFKGKTLGPLSLEKVRELVKRGQVTRLHDVSADGISWMQAEEFGDLFATKPSAAPSSRLESSNNDNQLSSRGPVLAIREGEPHDNSVEWYAHIDGEPTGPLTLTEIDALIKSGSLTSNTLIWRAGFDDWLPAKSSLPERFSQAPLASMNSHESPEAEITRGRVGIESRSILKGMVNSRISVLFLAISIMVFSSLQLLFFMATMLIADVASWSVGNERGSVPAGLCGITISGLMFAAGVLLLRYANSLKGLSAEREDLAIEAVRRVGVFWKYCALVVLVFQVLSLGGLLLTTVLAAAVASQEI